MARRKRYSVVEPLGGRHHVCALRRRTAGDWARQIKYLVDVMYPDAERITLVMDNLNTHAPSSLYKTFAPQEANRIWKRLDVHYTPKQGSWLDAAEIELNVLTRQCLGRRIATLEEPQREMSAWEKERNRLGSKVDWQFRTADARAKLASLYPGLG